MECILLHVMCKSLTTWGILMDFQVSLYIVLQWQIMIQKSGLSEE